jgi:hypothetical protein
MNARFKELVSENIVFNNVEEVPPPYYEVNQAIEKLKTHKATGIGQYASRTDKTWHDRTKTKDTQINNENMGRGDSTNRMDRRNNLSYI